MFSIDMAMTSYFLYGPGLTAYIISCIFITGCLILTLAFVATCKNNPTDYSRRLSAWEVEMTSENHEKRSSQHGQSRGDLPPIGDTPGRTNT